MVNLYIYIYESYGKLPFFTCPLPTKNTVQKQVVFVFFITYLRSSWWTNTVVFCRGCFWITTSWLHGVFFVRKNKTWVEQPFQDLRTGGENVKIQDQCGRLSRWSEEFWTTGGGANWWQSRDGRSSWGTTWKFSITIWAMKSTAVGWVKERGGIMINIDKPFRIQDPY